jgi:PhnB protein
VFGSDVRGEGRHEPHHEIEEHIMSMPTGPQVYISFPGTARVALQFYADVFGGELHLHSYSDFGRTDGPADAVAHGEVDGLVRVAGSDAAEGEPTVHVEGLLLSLLGTAEPATLRRWFDALAEHGEVHDPLQQRPWGAYDGQVSDQFGLRWLVGYEAAA